MSYLVLARKWRPKNFAETVGQEHVLKALTNALRSERLHHAYLFAGTRGVGKTTIARVLAKALNCESGIIAEPCGQCSACNEIDEGRFVDLIEVDAASKTKVDDTRDLLDNVQYAPARGRFKVYLIDEVHMLSRSSFNALLKTLEEPPPHVKFLLATTDPQKLPVTVLSRCLQFNLKRLTPTLIRDRLELICKEESIEVEQPALALISRAADGSLRDALSLLDQAIAFCGGDVREMPVSEMLGTIDRQHVSRLVSLLADGDPVGMMSVIAKVDEHFPDYARLLDDLARMLQRIAVFQVIGKIDIDDEYDVDEIELLASQIGAEDIQLFYQVAVTGRRDLHMAPDSRSGMEMTLLRMLAFQPAGGDKKRNDHKVVKKSSAPVARKKEAKPPIESPGSISAWQDPDWSDLMPRLGLTAVTRQLAGNCAYINREGDTLLFSLDKRAESYLTRDRKLKLADALSEFFDETLKVSIEVGVGKKETPAQVDKRREIEEVDTARSDLEADPNVRALKDMFGAELVEDSVEPLSNK